MLQMAVFKNGPLIACYVYCLAKCTSNAVLVITSEFKLLYFQFRHYDKSKSSAVSNAVTGSTGLMLS